MGHLCSLNIIKIILTSNAHLTYIPHHLHILPQVVDLLSSSAVYINYQIPCRPNCQRMINHAYYSYSNAHALKLYIYIQYILHLVLQVAAEKDVCAVHLNLKPKAHADIPFATNQIHVVAMLNLSLFTNLEISWIYLYALSIERN